MKLNGLILSGGKSTRMGCDKGLLNYHGKPQRDYLIDLVKPFCSEIFISSSKEVKASRPQNIIPDHFDLDSPLNGILSAFHYDPFTAWLTVPVDMPNINSDAIKYLVGQHDTQKLATCFFDSEGKQPEPLFTLWDARAKPLLFDFFNSGGVSPRKFLEENDVQILRIPDPKILVNINTQAELKAFLKLTGKTLQGGNKLI